MREYNNKLDKLNDCDVFLPPEIATRVPIEGRLVVVGVHHGVHHHVEGDQEESMAAVSIIIHVQEAYVHHVYVVENVQERYLAILLSEYKEHSLQQIHELVEEVGVTEPTLPVLVLMIQRQIGYATEVIVARTKHEVHTLYIWRYI